MDIVVTPRIRIPGDELREAFVRSSGPGGQNVNKVASKVELRVDPRLIRGLDSGARSRFEALIARRLDAQGQWLVTSQRTRDQFRNLLDAREKVRALVERSLTPPLPRRRTRPTQAAERRRIREKQRLAEIKRARGRVRDED
jgi:ribosome-associated protein